MAARRRPLVTGPTDDKFPSWGPDGTIAFVRGQTDLEIWTVREGETPKLLFDPPLDTVLRQPTWSPDGSRLAAWGE